MKINFDVQWLKAVKVKNNPYLPTSLTQNQEIRFTKTFQSINARYDNLFPVLDFTKDILFRFELFLRKRIQKLCLGKFKRPPRLEKSLKCIFLHQNNPYLKLGPFKFEYLHRNPEIGVVHEFATENEVRKIRNSAKGHMKSTPYTIGTKDNSYSKLRTSKVMYMNEKLVPEAMTISKKITLATKYDMKEDKYASENFQVMNYGIGGRISGHLDSNGTLFKGNCSKGFQVQNLVTQNLLIIQIRLPLKKEDCNFTSRTVKNHVCFSPRSV